MNKVLTFTLILLGALQTCVGPPVSQNKNKEHKEDDEAGGLEDYMEYHRYLREVVNALESDPQFRQKLEKADESDIRSGKIAEELEFVSHGVRSRLDEIKRVELERLNQLTEQQRKLQQNANFEDPTHRHLDHSNPHTFEIDDLKKLIAKTTEDLAEADKRRRDEFKQYELQKEFDKQVKLNHTNGDERNKLETEYRVREEKHKKHEKLHEPGHKAQLEEVWQEQDQMQQEFDPKTFFMLHDMDSNGLWDQNEVKALFIKELEKMYAAGEPEDDMRERAEEMERMRESVFKEVDLNRDGFIDYAEFLAQTKRNDFKQDHGWQGLDERRPYTEEELAEYIRQHEANQMAHGYPQGYQYPNQPYAGQGHPPVYQQVHPNAVRGPPQQHAQQFQEHLPDTNEVYPHLNQQNQPNQGQVHYQQQNQPPHGQIHYQQPNQSPQGQVAYQQQNQPPQDQVAYQQQNQPPQDQVAYQHQNQPPQGQVHYQQQNQPLQVNAHNQQLNQPPPNYQQPPQVVNYQQQPSQQGNPPQQEQVVGGSHEKISEPARENAQQVHANNPDTNKI